MWYLVLWNYSLRYFIRISAFQRFKPTIDSRIIRSTHFRNRQRRIQLSRYWLNKQRRNQAYRKNAWAKPNQTFHCFISFKLRLDKPHLQLYPPFIRHLLKPKNFYVLITPLIEFKNKFKAAVLTYIASQLYSNRDKKELQRTFHYIDTDNGCVIER